MENNNNNQIEKVDNSYNVLTIVGFVLGIISFFLNFWGIVGIAAVIISAVGIAQIYKKFQKGKVLGILGIVFGAINIIYASIVLVLCL